MKILLAIDGSQFGEIATQAMLPGRFLRGPFESEQRNYSENTAQIIDQEERRIVADIYARVKTILTQRRDDLERVAGELMRKETLTRQELDQLLASRSTTAA